MQPSSGAKCLIFWPDLSSISILHVCEQRMRRLARAFAGRLCDKCNNLMSWLNYTIKAFYSFKNIHIDDSAHWWKRRLFLLERLHKWASSWDYGTYHIGDKRRLRRACASAQSRQSLHCSHTWSMEEDEGSYKNQTSNPHWMAAHVRLKNEFTEDEKCHNLMSWLKWQSQFPIWPLP